MICAESIDAPDREDSPNLHSDASLRRATRTRARLSWRATAGRRTQTGTEPAHPTPLAGPIRRAAAVSRDAQDAEGRSVTAHRPVREEVEQTFAHGCERADFRLVHYSLQTRLAARGRVETKRTLGPQRYFGLLGQVFSMEVHAGHPADFGSAIASLRCRGGRQSLPFQGYRSDFSYEGDVPAVDGIYMIHPELELPTAPWSRTASRFPRVEPRACGSSCTKCASRFTGAGLVSEYGDSSWKVGDA